MKSGSWIAPHYAAARERTWHLSLLVAPGATAWSAHDHENGELAAICWSSDSAALDDEGIPASPKTASFVTLPEWSTMVPDAALAPGTEAEHLRLVQGGLPTGAMRSEPFDSIGATCIYVHDDDAERQVLDRYPHARAVPLQTLIARAALSRSTEGPLLVVHRSHDRLDVAAASQGRLLLSTTYQARSSQDTLYFALLAAEGAGVRPDALTLHHGGSHLNTHEQGLLQRYFMKAKPAFAAPSGRASDAGLEPHRWLALLEQFACVS